MLHTSTVIVKHLPFSLIITTPASRSHQHGKSAELCPCHLQGLYNLTCFKSIYGMTHCEGQTCSGNVWQFYASFTNDVCHVGGCRLRRHS